MLFNPVHESPTERFLYILRFNPRVKAFLFVSVSPSAVIDPKPTMTFGADTVGYLPTSLPTEYPPKNSIRFWEEREIGKKKRKRRGKNLIFNIDFIRH